MKDIESLENRKNEINNLFLDTNIPHDDIKKLSEEL
jgi:hypothetical protein